uniref:ribonuclease H n=1 Tax=Cyprinus carpio carpio TaxID=630221 RepID=A0A9J7YWS7_CYPCA
MAASALFKTLLYTVNNLLQQHKYKSALAVVKGFRNGAVYGAKIRAPHALVMTFLFRSGSLREKFRAIAQATYTHSRNLACFVLTYKGLQALQQRLQGKVLQSHSFLAACVGGWLVFGENNNINSQGRGVRQGCSLSPTLFNIYINELAEALERSGSIPGLALHDSEVKCLLYADDLVLLSPTAEGLQHSLALLEQYCEEWALTVNLDKTRVMVFQKKARSQGNRYQFSYGGEVLEHSSSYSNLGIEISASGGFSLAVKALNEKARRAFYAIKARFGQLKLPIRTWIKLYHAIIKPILLYGSEIWGPILKFENWDKNLIERTQLEFAKNILRVNRSTSNHACRAELGLYPLHIEIKKKSCSVLSSPDSI